MAGILLLGENKSHATRIRSLLREDGHEVVWHAEVDNWTERESQVAPEVVVATVRSMDRVLSAPGRRECGFPAPILFLQDEGEFSRQPFLPERLVDYVSSPFSSEELLARVDALVKVRRAIARNYGMETDEIDSGLQALPPARLAGRVRALLGARIPRYEKPLGPYLEVIARVAEWGDRRDAFQPGHQERVASLCSLMADGLQLDDKATSALLRAAMLHDIGKVALPMDVLHHSGPLEDSHLRLIRTHPRRGADLLRALDPDSDVADAVLYHHERPDGEGYYGREAERTPIAARILAVAEVYDAMTTSRHRESLTQGQALAKLQERKGELYDAECVDALTASLQAESMTETVSLS